MLQGLQARTVPAHAQLLVRVAEQAPTLVASFLGACPWPVEPQPSVHWCACSPVIVRSLSGGGDVVKDIVGCSYSPA